MRVEHHPKIARLSRKGKVQNPISHLPRKSESPTSPHILHVRRKNESPTSPQYCTLPRKSESLTSCSTAPFYAKFPECATPCFSMFTLRCFSCIGSFSTKFRLNDHADQGVFLPFHAIFTYLVLFKGSRGGAPCLISFYKFCWQTIIHSDPQDSPHQVNQTYCSYKATEV